MTTEAFPKIRRADLADAQAVADICNVAILSAMARFDIEPKSVAEHTQWLQSRDERHRVPVPWWIQWEVRGPNPLSRPITSNIKGQGRTNANAKSNKSLHTDLKHFRR